MANNQAGIVELPFCDLDCGPLRGEAVHRSFLTGAISDAALVESWLSTFDPEDSVRTLALYRRVSSGFLTWLGRRGLSLKTLTTADLARWRDELEGAAATRANRLAVIKSVLTHAHATGYNRFNAGRAVRGPRIDADADFRSLSEADVGRLIEAAEAELLVERGRKVARPRFVRTALAKLHLVRFLYYSACRVSEAVGVTWGDLRPRPDGDFQVTVVGKGRRRRSFPLSRWHVEQLRLDYGGEAQPGESRIFPFGARRAQTILKALAQRAGLDLRLSPHWLRHSAASHALAHGAPVHVVQQTLGHASLATTTRYAHKRADGAAKYLQRL